MKRRLVHHPAPYPDESITSYLERLARINHYDPSRLLTRWLRTKDDGGHIPLGQVMRQATFYQRLADLTGQSAARLFALSPHRLASVLLPPDAPGDGLELAGETMPLFPVRRARLLLRPSRTSAYCPACLREQGCHRLGWAVAAIAACPHHANWLLERCPQCGSALPIWAIVAGCCGQCGLNLCDVEALPLAGDELVLQVQQCLYAWIDGHPAPSDLRLPDASGQVLFRVLDGLRTAAQLARADWALAPDPSVMQSLPADIRYRLTPVQAGALYATALRGLKDWPDGFFAFLDAYRQRNDENGLNSLGILYSTWLEQYWQHPAFAFVQAAFNRYLTSQFPPVRSLFQPRRVRQQPDLVEQFPYIDVRNAARLLGTSPPKINRLIREGLLDIYPESDPARAGVLLYRSQVESFQEAQATAMNKSDAMAYLGVELVILNHLVEQGLLVPTGRRRWRGRWVPGLTQSDLDDLCTRLKPHVVLKPFPAEGGVMLSKAATLNGKVGLGLADLIGRVRAGKLPAYHPSDTLRPLGDLWFDLPVIQALTQQVKDENGWVSFEETLAMLRIGRRGLLYWMDSGLLVPVASFARAQYFLRDSVLDLKHRCVFTPEAVQMLGVPRTSLSQWVRAGYLDILSGPGTDNYRHYVFDRHVLEDWLATYVPAPEVKRMLQATNSMLHQWRQDGHLTPIVAGLPLPGFYRRDEVLRLQALLFSSPPAQKL
jgi:hypothetical protein